MVTTTQTAYLLLLSGDVQKARCMVRSRYPGSPQVLLSKRRLRETGWKGQVQTLRKLRGEALVIYADSLAGLKEPQLLLCSALLHGCRETVFADDSGAAKVYTRLALLLRLPVLVFSGFCDLLVLMTSWMLLRIFGLITQPQRQVTADACLDVAYLFPYPFDRAAPGGAMSHVTGFLSGLAANAASCEIFSGGWIPFDRFRLHEVRNRRRLYLLSESQALSYNIRFALSVKRQLAVRRPAILYQRHGRFVVAGTILSRFLSIPLVLEYNGSEVWISKHWDPVRFRGILQLCEEVCLKTAFLIVVVSDALRDELIQRGVPSERILVNPNAVDPTVFQPGRGGREMRTDLGFASSDIVVGFVGSFSYWHGIAILQRAITALMKGPKTRSGPTQLRFLLVGDGLLQAETRQALREYEQTGAVVFTGILPHHRIPSALDVCDILVSPHVPMPDGSPFFGSPTKIFEYMAMGKAIVASNLDQLSQLLDHGFTALLVPPGNEVELAAAIEVLANDPELRGRLGQNARARALDRHTWRINSAGVLACVNWAKPIHIEHMPLLTAARRNHDDD